jgi:hypothetical protein
LPEVSKYEILLSELSSIESELLVLSNSYSELQSKNKELEKQIAELHKDNAILQIKLQGKEKASVELGANFTDKLSNKERESLKLRLKEMVEKIDRHLG